MEKSKGGRQRSDERQAAVAVAVPADGSHVAQHLTNTTSFAWSKRRRLLPPSAK